MYQNPYTTKLRRNREILIKKLVEAEHQKSSQSSDMKDVNTDSAELRSEAESEPS